MSILCTKLTLNFCTIVSHARAVDNGPRYYGCCQFSRCYRFSRGEIFREPCQWPIEGLLCNFIGIGGQHASMYGSFIEKWAARTKADCHIAYETGAQSIWKSTENTTDSTNNKCTTRPSTHVRRTNARRQFQWTARFTGTSTTHDDAKRTARRLSSTAYATTEYAGRNGTESRSATHAGNSLYWTLRKTLFWYNHKIKSKS